VVKSLTRRQANGYLNAIMDIEKLFRGTDGSGSGSTGQRESMTEEDYVQAAMKIGLPPPKNYKKAGD